MHSILMKVMCVCNFHSDELIYKKREKSQN